MSCSKNILTRPTRLVAASLLAAAAAQLAGADVITFQNGVNGYTGTFDRKIGATSTNDANGADINTDAPRSFFIDGGASALNDTGVVQGLVRFDNIIGAGAIPANALILSATLDTFTTNTSNAQAGSGAYNVYRMNTPFDGTTTYASLGGDGIYNDVGRFGGSFNRAALNAPASARVDQIVQDWVNGTPNNGFGIRSDLTTDGWSYHTTGSAAVEKRPRLTVQYTTNPAARMAHYQQNVNGYTGTTDSFVNGLSGATVGAAVPGSAVEHGFLDGTNRGAAVENSYDQPYLVKFDNIDLSMPAITRAELILRSGFDNSNSGSGGSYSIHRILKPWDNSTTYDTLDSDGDATLTPVAELVANGFIAPASTETGAIGHAAVLNLDVTDIVKAWKDGAPNYGFYIGPTGTSDGWELYTSGAFGVVGVDDVTGQLAPELTILYSPDGLVVPEPASLGLAAVGGTLLVGRRRNRRR